MVQSTSDQPPILAGFKRCTRGEQCTHPDGPILPATIDFFTPRKNSKSPFTSWCKVCLAADQCARRNRDRDAFNEQRRDYYKTNNEVVKASNARYRNKDMGKQRRRTKAWRDANPEKSRQGGMLWQTKYPEKKRELNRVIIQKRRARKISLPDGFTLHDWQRCLEYFHNCCAVCGKPFESNKTTHADHWIPLSSVNCPGTIPVNIIPLCGGKDGCNNSKHKKHPLDWLIDKFGEEFAYRKFSEIQTYFEWILNHLEE